MRRLVMISSPHQARCGSCEAETASVMLVVTIGMLVALPAGVALSGYL
jgi:hypothetical protein